MEIARRMSGIKPSATLAMNAKTLELRARGVVVTSLAVGEPDFPTPAHVREAACAAVAEGFTRYTAVAGIPELREAVAGYYRRCYDVAADPACVIIENGGKQALYNLFLALLNPGDEVLVPSPYWVSYPDMIRLAEGVPVPVAAPAERGFKVSPADLEAARTPKTRVLVFNSPSNPTGACYSRPESDAIMQWALDHEIFVIADEIYDQLVYSPAQPASVSLWWEKYPERFAIANGLSKSFAMTGWRVGHTLAHPDLIKALSQLQGQTTANVCSIAQKAAAAALLGSYDCVAEMRAAFQRRRDMAHAEIASWPGVICPRPDGAFYLFADISTLFTPDLPDAGAVCAFLLEKARVAIMPGDAFGAPGCVRLSYAVSDESLMDALGRIRSALFG